MKLALSLLLAFGLGTVSLSTGFAADKRSTVLNANAVGIVASQPAVVNDAVTMARTLDHIDSLRVLPIVGAGSLQSLNDLLFLHGVDAAILSSDVLGYARTHSLYSKELDQVSYIAKLGNNSVIIVARTGINNIADLAGRKVATGSAESDSFLAADLVFSDASIQIERSSLGGRDALKAVSDGSVEAAVFTTAESAALLQSVEPGSGLHLVPISATQGLAEIYSPAIVEQAQFPNLMQAGTATETVASALIVAVVEWPKGSANDKKLKRFGASLFKNYLERLGDDKRTNFTAAVPGWKATSLGNKQSSSIPAVPESSLVAFSE